MKLEKLPDFAKPFKKKGFDVNKSGNRYQLFQISSKRVEGKQYPVATRTYIGTIDPVKGLIPKKVDPQKQSSEEFVEYGLSVFICKHLKRKVMRSIHGSDTAVFYMGLLYFMYGHVEDRFLDLTYVRHYLPEMPKISGPNALKRIQKAADNIAACLAEMFPDSSDRDYVCHCLRSITVSPTSSLPKVQYPSAVIAIFEKYGINYE